MAEIVFNKIVGDETQEWHLEVEEPIENLSQREQEYINRQIDIREFNQPRSHWLRELIGKFKLKFTPAIARFVNERSGKVVDTFDLQEEFDGSFHVRRD